MGDIILIDSDDERVVKKPRVEEMPQLTRGFNTGIGLMESSDEDSTGQGNGKENNNESESDSDGDSEKRSTKNSIGHDDSNENDGSDNDDDSSDNSDSGFVHSISSLTPESIEQTRRYLKENGNMRFLQKYLPTAASSDDITRLILQLGYVPRASHEDDIMRLIKFLNYVMTKVIATRTRLEDVKTVEDAVSKIRSAQKILVITGAGISTSLGIPDFRSSEGFYAQVQHLGLSDPQEVFDLEIFNTDPRLFYSIAHMILPPEKVYSPLHAFIAMLQAKGKLLRNYTQNIDNLESVAGIRPEKLVQCHGSFATATCMTCRTKVPGEQIEDKLKAQEIAYCSRCEEAKKKLMNDDDAYVPESFGVYKPDITFFGESLPDEFHDTINRDLHECDLLISVGTSLKVAPVADIVDKIPEHVPQILFNRDPIDHCNFDVSLLGYCDDVATYVCGLLGEDWEIVHPRVREIRERGLVCEMVDGENREYAIEPEPERSEGSNKDEINELERSESSNNDEDESNEPERNEGSNNEDELNGSRSEDPNKDEDELNGSRSESPNNNEDELNGSHSE